MIRDARSDMRNCCQGSKCTLFVIFFFQVSVFSSVFFITFFFYSFISLFKNEMIKEKCKTIKQIGNVFI